MQTNILGGLMQMLQQQQQHHEQAPQQQQQAQYHAGRSQSDMRKEAFRRLQPDTFSHCTDPLDADSWLRTVSKQLVMMECTDAECVSLASYLLRGAASAWWDTYVANHQDPDSISWDEFEQEFRAQHIPKGVMDRKADEFRNLKMGSMGVPEYYHRWTELSRYSPRDVSTEQVKISIFSFSSQIITIYSSQRFA